MALVLVTRKQTQAIEDNRIHTYKSRGHEYSRDKGHAQEGFYSISSLNGRSRDEDIMSKCLMLVHSIMDTVL